MFSSLVKTAFRSLLRRRASSVINITGLAIGLACFALTLIYVRHELSFDRFHTRADRIYRVAEQMRGSDGYFRRRASAGTPLAPLLKSEFLSIEKAVRIIKREGIVRGETTCLREEAFAFADTDVFAVFDFPLQQGDPGSALTDPFSVVVTEAAARKYFGDNDPIGKHLIFDNSLDLTVTGILKNIPSNSHLRFDFLASFEALNRTYRGWSEYWDSGVYTYILLRKGTASDDLEAQLPAFVERYRHDQTGVDITYWLQPLTKIHLEWEASSGRLLTISGIALFILLLSGANYVNLAGATIITRSREVAVRKVAGAPRAALIGQHLIESLLVSVLAMIAALGMIELALPTFNTMVGADLSFQADFGLWTQLLLATFLVGLICGIVPAFLLASVSPVRIMRVRSQIRRRGSWLRLGMVIFQFTVVVILVVSSLIALDQVTFLRDKDLGFDPENVIVINLENSAARKARDRLKQELVAIPSVSSVSSASSLPGGYSVNGLTYRVPETGQIRSVPTIWVDHDYLKTLNIELTEGRDFSADVPVDAGSAFILNQSALSELGVSAEGVERLQAFANPACEGTPWHEGSIIGTTTDFHFRCLRIALQPLVLVVAPERSTQLLIRITPGSYEETSVRLKRVWQKIVPDVPFESARLKSRLDAIYSHENQILSMLAWACALSLLVACAGLFGITTFLAEQRTTEIGIRKVMGASVPRILRLLAKDTLLMVSIANLIGWPIAYFLTERWLQDFIYRTQTDPAAFAAAGLGTIIVALLTVGYRAIKAALADPVKAIRYE